MKASCSVLNIQCKAQDPHAVCFTGVKPLPDHVFTSHWTQITAAQRIRASSNWSMSHRSPTAEQLLTGTELSTCLCINSEDAKTLTFTAKPSGWVGGDVCPSHCQGWKRHAMHPPISALWSWINLPASGTLSSSTEADCSWASQNLNDSSFKLFFLERSTANYQDLFICLLI